MELLTGIAIGAFGLAAWRSVAKPAVKGGLAAADHTRNIAKAVKDQVSDVVDQARQEQATPPKNGTKPRKKTASAA